MLLKSGDKVCYIGQEYPQHIGKVFTVGEFDLMRQNCILYVDNDLNSGNYFVAFWDEIEKVTDEQGIVTDGNGKRRALQ